MRTDMLIDGAFVAGKGEAPPVLDPAAGETVATIPEASDARIEAAAAAHG